MNEVQLKTGREKALLRGHPWIFSGSIANVVDSESPVSGGTVKVVDHPGEFLAWGAYSPDSQIRVRIWSRDQQDVIDRGFLRTRLENSFKLRKFIVQAGKTNAYRLVHAESDGLPGLIVDRYENTLVVQFLSSGAEFWRDTLTNLIEEMTGCERIYERSDAQVRKLEGLPLRNGSLSGNEDFEYLRMVENGLEFWVDIRHGQKTGFYLDQRDNRSIVRKLATNRSVLDCFAYSGGFSISAMAGDAERVVAIDSSKKALELGKKNVSLNAFPDEKIEWVEADVFQALRTYRDRNEKFDMVILDPPKFAPTAAHAKRAARGYKDINLLGLKLLNPGGILVTHSCSGGVGVELFQKILAGAALDAGVDAKIVARLGPGPDHPVALNFPEGSYLKGFVIQV